MVASGARVQIQNGVNVSKPLVLNGGTLDGKRILGRKTVELMTANHLTTLPNNQALTRQKGFGLGVEMTTDLGQLSMPSSAAPP